MKKILSVLVLAGMTSLVACGPSADEIAAEAKRVQDSIATVEQAMKDAIAAAEKASADSVAQVVAAAAAQFTADSLEAATVAAKKKAAVKPKKATNQIKAGQPLPGRPGAVKK